MMPLSKTSAPLRSEEKPRPPSLFSSFAYEIAIGFVVLVLIGLIVMIMRFEQ